MIKMLYDKVIIKPFDKDFFVDEEGHRKTKSGRLYIPENIEGMDKAEEGVVIASGPGIYDHGIFISNETKAGDKVLFGKFAGSRMKIENEEVLIMKDKDIIAILGKAKKKSGDKND